MIRVFITFILYENTNIIFIVRSYTNIIFTSQFNFKPDVIR